MKNRNYVINIIELSKWKSLSTLLLNILIYPQKVNAVAVKKCLTIYRKYDIIIYIDYKVILYF